jgi:hypothetical protein
LVRADGAIGDELLHSSVLATLKALIALRGGKAKSGAWRKATRGDDGEPLPQRTFQNHRAELVERKAVEAVEGTDHTYQVTELGRAIATGVPLACHGTPPCAATSPTL